MVNTVFWRETDGFPLDAQHPDTFVPAMPLTERQFAALRQFVDQLQCKCVPYLCTSLS